MGAQGDMQAESVVIACMKQIISGLTERPRQPETRPNPLISRGTRQCASPAWENPQAAAILHLKHFLHRKPTSIHENDIRNAAHALEHAAPLLTSDLHSDPLPQVMRAVA
jgi:hypothetical protein